MRDHGLRRVAAASYVGSVIEFYDFVIYGTAAALVFPTVFFPHLGHVMAVVASLGTFASAFVARPVGAVLFGHFGDRLGRKRALVVTLLMMGVATVGVGLIPSTAAIGVAAPLLLTALRVLQGLALGGEWAGSALLSTEHAPDGRRGYYGMFTQLGLGSALVLANLVFLLVYGGFGADNPTLLSWGWRVPFLLSAVLIVTALVVRTRVSESPAFVETDMDGDREAPITTLLREQRRRFVLVSVAVVGMLALVYETGTFFTHFASIHSGFSTSAVLLVGVLGGLCTVGAVAAAAILSDTYGRRRIITIGYCLAVPWSFAVLPLIAIGNAVLFAAAIMVTYTVIGIAMGPIAAFVPEMFATRYRYTGAGLSYNIGGIIGGGIPPVISEYLLSEYGTLSIGVMLGSLCAVSLLAVRMLKDGAEPSRKTANDPA